MPIPFLVIGALAVTGLVGAGKSVSAAIDNSDAKDINAEAERILAAARRRLQDARRKSSLELEQLGKKKVETWESHLQRFLKVNKRIRNVALEKIDGLDEVSKLSKERLVEMKVSCDHVLALFGGGAAGLAAGASTAFVSFGAVGALATASTGTAISSLAGVAATNATLAWLGGGSLAVGGLGVAGGTAILGGIVAAPALLVFGLVASSKAKENLANAKANRSQARRSSAEADVLVAACNGIAERASLFWNALDEIGRRLQISLSVIESGLKREGVDYTKFTKALRSEVMRSYALADVAWTLCDAALLDKTGKLTDESSRKLANAQRLIEA